MADNNLILQIDHKDNVAVALRTLLEGQRVMLNDTEYVLKEEILVGHKVALEDIEANQDVIKYGYSIGKAITYIKSGEVVHSHNLKTSLQGPQTYHYHPQLVDREKQLPEGSVFLGYQREDGQVGIRNEIWIISTVGCCNSIAEILRKKALEAFGDRNIDGIYHFAHPFGCSQMGEDLLNTQKILAGLVKHPNAGGVLVVGLGCENNNIDAFKKIIGLCDESRVKFLNLQDVDDEVGAGLKLLGELTSYAEQFKRTEASVEKLILGLKCGGSDAFSGITANPIVGEVADRVIDVGGSAILTEVPEMFGAETILMNRAINEDVFKKIVSLINGFKEYFLKHGQVVYDNPSPGNKKGGITTLEEKSLGCVRKGGSNSVVDVVNYGDQTVVSGLNLLNGPGNDMAAITALAAAGAQVILFTTGCGTPLGCPIPTIKVSSNSRLASMKKSWIDFDAGKLLTGESMQILTDELMNCLLEIISGKTLARNEENDDRQIALFKSGVFL